MIEECYAKGNRSSITSQCHPNKYESANGRKIYSSIWQRCDTCEYISNLPSESTVDFVLSAHHLNLIDFTARISSNSRFSLKIKAEFIISGERFLFMNYVIGMPWHFPQISPRILPEMGR